MATAFFVVVGALVVVVVEAVVFLGGLGLTLLVLVSGLDSDVSKSLGGGGLALLPLSTQHLIDCAGH